MMVTKLEKVSVVTVGVGWAGGIVAAELTKAGYSVVGLERGGERSTEDFLLGHDELKYGNRKELIHSLSKDTVTTRNDESIQALPIRSQSSFVTGTGVGGSGTHWSAQVYRFDPYDFEIRTKTIERYGEEKIPEDMTIQDWGITYDEIEPYYDKFEKMAGISGENFKFSPPRSNPYPNPPMKKTPLMELFHRASEKLGMNPYVMPSGNMSQAYTNPDGQTLNACQYCAFCTEFGCEYGAKSDPLVTVIPTAKKTGKFEIRTSSYVKRVLYKGNKATGVLYIDLNTGEEFEQPADIVVLSAYTLNNVRLLLLSKIGKPYDLETGTGIIGKNLTSHHNNGGARGFFNDKKFNLYVGAGALGSSIANFSADNFDHSDKNFIHGAEIALMLMGNAPIQNNYVPQGTPSWGPDFKKQMLHYSNRIVTIMTQRGSMPTKYNYIDLDPVYKDAHGDPLLRLTLDYTDNDRAIDEMIVGKCVDILNEMGADIVEPTKIPDHWTSYYLGLHVGGGAIIGADSETSALNNYSQMWDMENLFVCGANAFPHFGTTNPTNTIGALTYRATEGMIQYLQNGGGLLVESKSSNAFV